MLKSARHSPAAQILLSDLIENILRYADNPGSCAEYVTTQIRELIGVSVVALVSSEAGNSHALVGICPRRKKEFWNQQAVQHFITSAATYDTPRLIDPQTDPVGQSLAAVGIGTSFVIPLSVGPERVGMLILFDLLDQTGGAIILETLIWVSRALALILKNSFLFRNLEQTVAIRTEELRQLNAELEQRVEDRTAQLQASNKELEAFCYSVSHDLRAPLRHLDGYVALLVRRCRADLDEKGLHYLDTIAASARQMGALTDDLLQFSRTGRVELQQKKVDMNLALQEALTPVQEACAGRTIEWVIGELPAVIGDLALLRQVWANLLENAVKFTRTREVARIEVDSSSENGKTIFVVADNGVGFDMRYADKLFGVFQRLHSQAEFEGTGIGLATVQRIIARHGGRVWAGAEPELGARFYFSLPKTKEGPHD